MCESIVRPGASHLVWPESELVEVVISTSASQTERDSFVSRVRSDGVLIEV